MDKPRVLILGGCGFVGRNLLSHLISNNLVSYVRIVDKVPPQVAWLNSNFQKYYDDSRVEFKSANLINQESCKNAFMPLENEAGWDYIINCASETKLGQTDPVYNEGILKLSVNCAKEAALMKPKHYIEISSGQMYSSEKHKHKEDDNVEPWTFMSKWKRSVEEEVMKIPGLPYTILRPALIYGMGDKHGLSTRIIIAAIYRRQNETMKLLWNSDMKLNTIHVTDLCRAIWFVCNTGNTIGQIYNVVDKVDSTQGSISNILSDLFNIKVDYYGTLVSSAVDLSNAADEANDKHLEPWAESCRNDNVPNTPLSPHMDQELLLHKHLNLDGTKLYNMGFELTVPEPNIKLIKDIVDDFVTMKIFPSSLAP